MFRKTRLCIGLIAALAVSLPPAAWAAPETCDEVPSASAVSAALAAAVSQNNGGFGNHRWATVVNRFGTVCLIVTTAPNLNPIWLGGRVISAQKASTANAFSLPDNAPGNPIALSTANLYSAVRPGGSLFGLLDTNPIDPAVAYAGTIAKYGRGIEDPLYFKKIGGVNQFGGGLALYGPGGYRMGGIGIGGDTPCADHFVAWRIRRALVLDYVAAGVSPENDDNMIQDIDPGTGVSPSGFGHPLCHNNRDPATLPDVRRPS